MSRFPPPATCKKCGRLFSGQEAKAGFEYCEHCEPLFSDEEPSEGSSRVGEDLKRSDPPDLYERIAQIIGADPDDSEAALCAEVEARMVELRQLRTLGQQRAAEEGAALDLEEPGHRLDHYMTIELGELTDDELAELGAGDVQMDSDRLGEWAPTIAQIEAGDLSEVEGWIGDAEPNDTVEMPAAVLQALLRQIRPVEPKGSTK